MRRNRSTSLLLAATLLAGCAGPGLLLDVRLGGSTDPATSSLDQRYGQLADRLQAHASFYDYEVRKNHTKLRVMGALSVLGAGAAAGTTSVAFQPSLPDDARAPIAGLSISMSVLSAIFVLLPHAHQYILKEAGYQRMAEATRRGYIELEAVCGPSATSQTRRSDCVELAQEALMTARSFPEDSPCKPPPDKDLDQLLKRAGRGQ